jgi:choline dehydrogenase-like flavoprotein
MRKLSCDVVVVGSGAGGATVAGELGRQGRSVIVLEAGPAHGHRPGEHGQNVDTSEDGLEAIAEYIAEQLTSHSRAEAGTTGLPGLRVRHGVGGMLTAWLHYCPLMDESELPSGVPAEDWPEMLDRAHDRLSVHADLEAGGVRLGRLLDRIKNAVRERPEDRDVQPMPFAAEMRDGALWYTGAAELLDVGGEAVTVHADLVVHSILQRDGRATGVVAHPRGGGEPVTVTAGAVVIAGGTVGSAQLLAASDVDAGPALGRYLMEHPTLIGRVRLRPEIREGIPATDPMFSIWVPYTEKHQVHHIIFRLPDGFSAGVDGPAKETADVGSYTGIEPSPDNRLIFERGQLDGFGLPTVSAEYHLSRLDRQNLASAIEEHVMIASEIGELELGWSPTLFPAGASFHLMGSCRMGVKDDGESVVDADGRLWRYDNLFVAGNAVYDRPNGSNPTFTTVAMSLRCADAVLACLETRAAAV